MTEKLKCSYPGCKKEGLYMQAFGLINEENASVELPFCKYHHLIVMGGHFKAEISRGTVYPDRTKSEDTFKIIGPLKEVEVAEQVIGAREMIAQLKSDDKSLKR